MERNGVAEKFPVPWSIDRALGLIDHELESLSRPFAFDLDVAVIGKTAEAMPTLLQFSIQLREEDVGK